jgi:hypothetical protein
MLKLRSTSIIYIAIPFVLNRPILGGRLSLCQLAIELRRQGRDARIILFKHEGRTPEFCNQSEIKQTTNDKYFSEIDLPIDQTLEDREENVFIVPEFAQVYLLLYKVKKTQPALWWLGKVYFGYSSRLRRFPTLQLKTQVPSETTHLYQSEYVGTFLRKAGIEKRISLSTPMEASYFLPYSKPEKIMGRVVYNTDDRSNTHVENMKRLDPTLEWVSLKGLSKEDLVKLLRSSSIYLDLGEFPGRERLPREAVLCGCCVVIARNGASSFYEEFPIPSQYMVPVSPFSGVNYKKALELIHFCRDHYDEAFENYQGLLAHTLAGPKQFQLEVSKTFLTDELRSKC